LVWASQRGPHRKVVQVFELHGLQYREFDGSMTVKARNQALHDFERDESVLILLMSNVGAVGLNITRASVVIFVVSKL
jgi:SNF2 family DNA or RNA helicase